MPSLESTGRCNEEFDELFALRLEMEAKIRSWVRSYSFSPDGTPHAIDPELPSLDEALSSPEYHAWLTEYNQRIATIHAKYDAILKQG